MAGRDETIVHCANSTSKTTITAITSVAQHTHTTTTTTPTPPPTHPVMQTKLIALVVAVLATATLQVKAAPVPVPAGCMQPGYTCTTLTTQGRYNGKTISILSAGMASNAQRTWGANDCARRCAISQACVYWIVRTAPSRCILKAKKGNKYVEDYSAQHGDRDPNCAKPTCSNVAVTMDDQTPMPTPVMDAGGPTVASQSHEAVAADISTPAAAVAIACMDPTSACTRFASEGYYNGASMRSLPKRLAPDGNRWTPNDCARRCTSTKGCGYWVIKPTPDHTCILRSAKGTGKLFTAMAGWVHGTRDESCRAICAGTTRAVQTTTDELGGECTRDMRPGGRYGGAVSRVLPNTAAPGGVVWLPEACATQCRLDRESCAYWVVNQQKGCVLKKSKNTKIWATDMATASPTLSHGVCHDHTSDGDQTNQVNKRQPGANNTTAGTCHESVHTSSPARAYPHKATIIATLHREGTSSDVNSGSAAQDGRDVWQDCAAQCATHQDCTYWFVTASACVLTMQKVKHLDTTIQHMLYDGDKDCGCMTDGAAPCIPVAKVCLTNPATGQLFADPTPLEQFFEPAAPGMQSLASNHLTTTALRHTSKERCAEACLAYTDTAKPGKPCLHFTFDTATKSCKLYASRRLVPGGSTFSGTAETRVTFVNRKRSLAKCSMWSTPLALLETEVAGLPRVLLLGDSISVGYTLQTRQNLAGKANVHRPYANCQSSRNAITQKTGAHHDGGRWDSRNATRLDSWLAAKPSWDVIHFNFGLHDLKRMHDDGRDLAYETDAKRALNLTQEGRSLEATNTDGSDGGDVLKEIVKYSASPQTALAHSSASAHSQTSSTAQSKMLAGATRNVPLEEYTKNLDRIVTRLKETGAKLIWRTTTPIVPGSLGRVVGDEVLYNEAAALVMIRHGVPTNDQYMRLVSKQKEYMLPADVHFTYPGYTALAKGVADAVAAALPAKGVADAVAAALPVAAAIHAGSSKNVPRSDSAQAPVAESATGPLIAAGAIAVILAVAVAVAAF